MPRHNQPSRPQGRRHRGRQRHVRIRSQLRAQPDLEKIASTVVALALAQAEKDAQGQTTDHSKEIGGESVDA